MTEKNPLAKVAPLFLVLFIDGMGLSLLFPIVNSLIIETSSHFVPHATSLATREFLYGLIIGIYMICWFFGAAILGDLSDKTGRKKSLMVCLIGACIGYVFSGIAVNTSSIALLIVGRIVAGFTAGSQPIAQAAIVDVSTGQHKARNIGLILFAISMGFVLGPLIGGVLSDSNIVSWFGFSTPLYFAALLSLVNAFLLQVMFKETFIIAGETKIKVLRGITIFIEAFRHPKIRALSLVMFIMIFGWANFYTFIPLYVHELFHYGTLDQSYFMAVLGVGFAIGCGYIVDYCSQRFDNQKNVIWGSFAAAFFILLMLLVPSRIAAWIFTVFVGASVCVAYSIIITLFSDQVSEDEQGWIMGVTGSIMALCFGLSSFLTGIIVSAGPKLPLILAICGLALSALILCFVKLPSKEQDISRTA